MGDLLLGNVPALSEPTVVARVYAALPAASAWDTDPLVEFPVAEFAYAMFYVTYERAVAGGIIDVQVQLSPYATDALAPAATRVWFDPVEIDIPVGAVGTPYTDLTQTAFWQFDSEAARDIFYIGPLDLSHYGAERMRVRARESGDDQNPGTAEIVVKLSV